jgi:hypothetical protein
MRRVILLLILVTSVKSVFSQAEHKSLLLIEGQIVDERALPISYVNIFIKARTTGAISDYYGNYRIAGLPGDTLTFSAVAFRKTSFIIPADLATSGYRLNVVLQSDTVGLDEVVIYPWPSTYKQFKEDFLELEVEDPLANLDLNLPSLKDIAAFNRTPGEPGQVGIYSGAGPVSLLYDQFSKEAKSRRLYAEVIRKESAEKRYNRAVVSRITGLQKEEDITAFMRFCPLDTKFILKSSDYDLFLAIRTCYVEFARLEIPTDTIYTDTIR